MNVATFLQAITTMLWVAVVALVVLTVIRASRGVRVRSMVTTILILAGTALILTLVSAGLVFIQPEERGVVISAIDPKGYRAEPLDPGLHWIVPFLENVKHYPISRQTYTMSGVEAEGAVQGDDSIKARTSDGQEVLIDASVIFAIDPDEVVNVNIEWQDRYVNDVVRPLARGAIRDTVSQYGVQEVYSTKRSDMTQKITEQLSQTLKDNGLSLLDFVLRNITFSPEYAASVEQKQIAEQQAQQAKFTVEQRKQEAEQARQVAQGQADAAVINAKGQADARIIQSEAEAKALELIAAALATNPDLLQYTYVTRLAPGVQVMLVPSNSPYLFPLPTMEPSTSVTGTGSVIPSILPTLAPTPMLQVTPTP
jgi:regulator of protease activity HflC (stomatin/prohibitin superfamily)